MNFDLNKTQQMLQESARTFFQRECPITNVREIIDSEHGHDNDLWNGIAEQGWIGLTLPEEHEIELGLRIRAHHNLQLLASPYTVRGAVTFNPRATPASHVASPYGGIGKSIGEHPVPRAGLGVFDLDQVSSILSESIGNADRA